MDRNAKLSGLIAAGILLIAAGIALMTGFVRVYHYDGMNEGYSIHAGSNYCVGYETRGVTGPFFWLPLVGGNVDSSTCA